MRLTGALPWPKAKSGKLEAGIHEKARLWPRLFVPASGWKVLNYSIPVNMCMGRTFLFTMLTNANVFHQNSFFADEKRVLTWKNWRIFTGQGMFRGF
jgi:hypothetical protein